MDFKRSCSSRDISNAEYAEAESFQVADSENTVSIERQSIAVKMKRNVQQLKYKRKTIVILFLECDRVKSKKEIEMNERIYLKHI